MKLKNLLLILAIGLFVASCTDKKAAEELTKLKADMKMADSICTADKTMLMDSIAMMQVGMDSLMAAMPVKNTTSSSSTKGSTTTKTTTTTTETKPNVSTKDGATKTGETKADVKKKSGATKTGGN